MELSVFLRILRAHWLTTVGITAAGVLLALGWTLTQPRVYTADASGVVAVEANDEAGSSFTTNSLASVRVPTYVELGSLRSVAEYAQEELGIDDSPESLVSRVRVLNPAETLMITVEATGPTPESARDLAEVWVRGMAEEVNLLETGSADTQGDIFLAPRDSARLPTSPSSPNTELAFAVGATAGLGLGILYALFRHYMDRRLRNPEDVEKETGVAVIGSIPVEKTLSPDSALIFDPATGNSSTRVFALAEALRSLRTNLRFTDIDQPPRAIVTTSPVPGDGKSTISANLALTMAASGQRTVLIDGDLRRPMQSTLFRLPSGAGLTDVLSGSVSLGNALHPIGQDGNLLVLSAGSLPPNPSEVLGSNRMKELIDMIRKEAFVIIDAPPVIPVTDAAALSTLTDGAIVITSAGSTTFEMLGKAIDNLQKVHGRALGVVLNRVPQKGLGATYYGYQYTGDYYGTEDSDRSATSSTDSPRRARRQESQGRRSAARRR